MIGQIAGPVQSRSRRPCWCGRVHKPTFHVWLDESFWRWCCTLCDPQTRGARSWRYYGGVSRCLYRTVLRSTMRYHFRRREQHHAWVRSHRCGLSP